MTEEKETAQFTNEAGKIVTVIYPKGLEIRWTMFRKWGITNGVHPFTMADLILAINKSESGDEIEIISITESEDESEDEETEDKTFKKLLRLSKIDIKNLEEKLKLLSVRPLVEQPRGERRPNKHFVKNRMCNNEH